MCTLPRPAFEDSAWEDSALEDSALKRRLAFARALGARARPYVPALVWSGALGGMCIRGILEKTGGQPAVPLDDSFIHFQYARRFAEGHPFTFTEGGGFSSGATSFIWPILLAPFHLLGARGLGIIWAAWLLGALLHAATAVETTRLATPLVGRGPGIAAGVMAAVFGAFAWFAWSGMETIGLAWALVRTARVASEWAELPAHQRAWRRGLFTVGGMGFVAPLFRPEGLIAAAIAALVLAVWPARPEGSLDSRRDLRTARLALRGLPLLPILGVAVVPLLHLVLTGHAGSSTTSVKWLVGNPYYAGARLWSAIGQNLLLMRDDLLVGGTYTAIFIPRWSLIAFALGAAAIIWLAGMEKRWARMAFILALALATLIPATYLTMLWNRVRYIYPFAPAWFVLVAAAASAAGRLTSRFFPDGTGVAIGSVLSGLYAGALADKLPWAMEDLATSAAAIDGQQVKLGKWAHNALPRDARIGVNDTGAIAYLSERTTFDVVGLTTEGEARYWVGGAGARFEHYERMPRQALPTHFIVYAEWMSLWAVLGEELHHATVTDQSILGGQTKTAFVARWDTLGSGALPTESAADGEAPPGKLLAEVDVADLESEAAAGYALGDAWDADCKAVFIDGMALSPDRRAEGGRVRRTFDTFSVQLPAGAPVRMTMRLSNEEPVVITVRAGGAEVSHLDIPAGEWVERSVVLPPGPGGRIPIEVRAAAGTTFGSLHYWFFLTD